MQTPLADRAFRCYNVNTQSGEEKEESGLKIGILGTGSIAHMMAGTIQEMAEVQNYAVASRSYEKAEAFGEKFGFEKAYGSYEELAQDPDVELIYVATPHSEHYANAKLCLQYGKPLLVEKAFTVNYRQAAELVSLAKEKNTFLAEAFWTRYMPLRKTLEELLKSGIIGEVTSLTANFGFPLTHIPRLMDPSLAGGALLDLGVYPINFAAMVFGAEVEAVSSLMILSETGVDAQSSITLRYKGGRLAVLHSNLAARTDQNGVIYGSKGLIQVEDINNFTRITVLDTDKNEIAVYERPAQISGYEYEVLAAVKAITEGKTECEKMPHEETLRIMKLLDSLRAEWNLKYPCE